MSRLHVLSLFVYMCGYGLAQSSLSPASSADDVQKIQEALRRHPPEAFKKVLATRQQARRTLQRRGYAEILYENMHGDPLNALISYFKMKVQMDLSLSQGFLFWIVPPDPTVNRPGIAFEEDKKFPVDPWDER